MSSSSRSVLIIGGSGFVGTHLARRLRRRWRVYATYRSFPMRIDGVTTLPLNIADSDALRRCMYLSRPDAIVYLAGSSELENRVLTTMREREQTLKILDLLLTSGAAAALGASQIFQPKFVYLSNAYVFDGEKGDYHENDLIFAANDVGRIKVNGENLVRNKSMNYGIFRCSPILGFGPGNRQTILDKMRWSREHGKVLELPDDEFHSFVDIHYVTETIERWLEGGPKNRTFHLSGLTSLTPYEMGLVAGRKLGFSTSQLKATRQGGGLGVANVEVPPRDFTLNSTKLVESLKIQPLLLEQGLDLIEQNLISTF
jgi:dTDP-4-dehydrorhamnose reductase